MKLLKLAQDFYRKAEISEQEMDWLSSTTPKYVRPSDTPLSSSEIAAQIKEDPLKKWRIDGLYHTIRLLQPTLRSYRLTGKDTSNIEKTIHMIREVINDLEK